MEDLFEIAGCLSGQQVKAENYRDEEGYLCCGKCHTRMECLSEFPITGRKDKLGRFIRPTPCRCRAEAIERRNAEDAERKHREKVRGLKNFCFTSPDLKHCRFENATKATPDVVRKAKRFVRDWETVKKKNCGLLHWGDCGTSKTFIAACIANALMEQEIPVMMRNLSDFMSGSFEEREELIRKLTSYPLVILDDFGMERGTEYGLEIIFRVIDARYNSGKPTIITTNLTLNELKNPPDRAHKRIYDRILEMCIPVAFGSKSVRGELAAEKSRTMREVFEEEAY